MEKTNYDDPRSGEGCYVPKNPEEEQHLIGRREQKLITDKGPADAAAAVAEADADIPVIPKRKSWFGWWAAGLLAVVAMGICLYYASKEATLETQRSAYSYSAQTVRTDGNATRLAATAADRNAAGVEIATAADRNAAGVGATAGADRRAASSMAQASGNVGGTSPAGRNVDAAYAPMATDESITAASKADATVDYLYYFGNDKSAVADNRLLDEIAEKAREAGADITVTAYASAVGSASHNQQLSEERAVNLATYLISHGVPADHVHVQAAGATGRYGDYAHNRRADILVDYAG